jgi:hypothetical protein
MSDAGITELRLTVRIDNTRPVEITDLGRSLQALGKQYEDFVVLHGYDQTPANAQLFVSHLETGSIIVTLQTFLEQASFVLKYIDVLAGFVGNLNEIMNFLLRQDSVAKPPITRPDAERMSKMSRSRKRGASAFSNSERYSPLNLGETQWQYSALKLSPKCRIFPRC